MTEAHPWMRIQEAIKEGDKEKAESVLRNSEQLTGSARIAAYSAIKGAFPEEPPEFVSAGERQRLEDERGDNSPIADSLARRREGRQKRAAALLKNHKPSIGPLVPPKEGVQYTEPSPGGFATPINDTAGTRKGAGRSKVAAWVPGSGG